MHAQLFCRPAGVEFVAPLFEPIDIGLGGLRIHDHEERRVGSVVRLDAFFPDVARVTLATQVVWIKALGKEAPAPFDVGLEFVELNPTAQSTLRMLLDVAEHEGHPATMVESARARVQSPARLARNGPKAMGDGTSAGGGVVNWDERTSAKGGVVDSKGALAIDVEIDNALALLDESAAWQSAASSEPGRGFSPPSTNRVAAGAVVPTTLPQSRRGAVLADSDAPVISQYEIDPSRYVLDRYLAGDYAGALDIADVVLTETPGNLLVRECRDRSRDALAKVYAEKVGPLGRVPVVIAESAEAQCASIDHRAAFLLSLVDGTSTLEAILDACAMPRLDALRIVQEMVLRKIVGFG